MLEALLELGRALELSAKQAKAVEDTGNNSRQQNQHKRG